MRQLDLFGMQFDSSPAAELNAEKQVVLKKEENGLLVSQEAETTFFIAEPAEEMIAEKVYVQNEIPEGSHLVSNNNLIAKEVETSPFLQNKIATKGSSEAANAEKLQVDDELIDKVSEENVRIENFVQKELPNSQRQGEVIFDDGKISVKVKIKPAIAPEIVIEEEKREPQKRGRKPVKEIEAEADLIEVPEDEVLFQKQYYSISEVAKWFRVNTSLLRFWENEFDILKPRKNKKGDRLFRPEDVKNLQLIYQLLRLRKYTIEGAKEYIKTNGKKADVELQLTNTLQKFKSFLLDLKANL